MNRSLLFHTGNLNKQEYFSLYFKQNKKKQAHENNLNIKALKATLARVALCCEIAANEQKITNYMTR